MKSSRIFLWSLAAVAGGCLPAALAEPWIPAAGSGPETTLDSLWGASSHMQAFAETVDAQLGMHRFREERTYRFWFGSMGAFGNADVRKGHPDFDYSAGGGALGFDSCWSEGGQGMLLGLALGCMSGTQNTGEMADHPDGFLEGDKFDQDSLMAALYGEICKQTGPRSHLFLSMNIGIGTTSNKCRHHGIDYEASRWDTETWNVSFSAAWRYQATRSFAVIPFAKVGYMHASNKVRKDGWYDDDDDSWWWDAVDEIWKSHSHSRWKNRGTLDNVALEIGLTLEHVIRFSGGRTWTNAVSGSYCPDVYRNDPHHTFHDTWWEGEEVYQTQYRGKGYSPSRQAFKAKFTSRLTCSERVALYASYQACFREDYLEHRAALGVTVSF